MSVASSVGTVARVQIAPVCVPAPGSDAYRLAQNCRIGRCPARAAIVLDKGRYQAAAIGAGRAFGAPFGVVRAVIAGSPRVTYRAGGTTLRGFCCEAGLLCALVTRPAVGFRSSHWPRDAVDHPESVACRAARRIRRVKMRSVSHRVCDIGQMASEAIGWLDGPPPPSLVLL